MELLLAWCAEAKPFQPLGRDKRHGVPPVRKDPLLTDGMYCDLKEYVDAIVYGLNQARPRGSPLAQAGKQHS